MFRRMRKSAAPAGALAAAYFLAGKLGLLFALVGHHVTLLWAPSGIALAALVRGGYRLWPGVALGAFLVNLSAGAPPAAAAGVAAGNTLAALAAAALLRRAGCRPSLDRVRDAVALVGLGALLSPAVAASVGTVSLAAVGCIDPGRGAAAWLYWWLGDGMGVLLVAPALLTWADRPQPAWRPWRAAEAAALVAALVLTTQVVYGGWFGDALVVAPLAVAVVPVLLWAAVRFGPRGAAAANLIAAAAAAVETLQGTGPFARGVGSHGLLLAFAFFAQTAVVALLFAAFLAERDRAAAELRDSHRRHAEVLDSISDAFFALDRSWRFTRVNRQAEAVLGAPAERLLGRSLWAAVPRAAGAAFEAYLRRAAGAGRPAHFEARTAGGRRWVSVTAYPSADGLAVFCQDVTDRRRAEERLRRQWQLTGTIAHRAAEALFLTDAAGRVTFANPAAEALLGRSRAAMLGRVLHDLVHRHSPGRPADCPLGRAVRAGASIHNHEDVFVRRDGRPVPVLCSSAPVHDGADAAGAVLVVNDITDRVQLVSELRRRAEALAEADRRKDEFLATLAHELRNPLAPIRTALEVLRLAADDPDQRRQAQALMARQVGQMVRLIDDLLDVSRITRGNVALRKERVDVAAVVRLAVETSRPQVAAAGHRLTVELPDGPVELHADPTRLAQVVSNLLNNAARYTPDGGRIWLSVAREGVGVAIRVRDTGVGIPPEALPTVFDLFVQADRTAARSQGGLGIGLTLVKRLVELHGGRVYAESDGPGRGCEFVVHLPLAASGGRQPPGKTRNRLSACEVHRGADGDPLRGYPGSPKSVRVLVVDDNADAATSLAALLRLRGHAVRVAHDGPAALAAADEFRPDVVLLDLGMPGMDGCEVARRFRAHPDHAAARLVALTGWGQAEDRRRTRAAGFDEHLVKPVDPDDVWAALAGGGRPATAAG